MTDVNDTPRLALRTAEDDPKVAELFAKGLRRADGQVLNIYAALAHHPDLLRRWLVFAAHVLAKSTLDPRVRELLILRTGSAVGSAPRRSKRSRPVRPTRRGAGRTRCC